MAAPLSRQRITEAALAVVEADGLEGLSMRKVASRLDVEAMSLYRHVANKADLLDALQEQVLAQVPTTTEGDWPDQVRAIATAFRELLFAHPAIVPLLATRPATTPAGLALVERGVAILQDHAGFDEDAAVVAFQTVFVFVVGHAVFHTAGGQLSDDAWAREEFTRGLEIVIRGLTT